MKITFILKEKCRSPWVVLRNLRLEVRTLIPALAGEFTLLVVVAHNAVRLIFEHLQWHTDICSERPDKRNKTYAESVLRIHTHKGSVWQTEIHIFVSPNQVKVIYHMMCNNGLDKPPQATLRTKMKQDIYSTFWRHEMDLSHAINVRLFQNCQTDCNIDSCPRVQWPKLA